MRQQLQRFIHTVLFIHNWSSWHQTNQINIPDHGLLLTFHTRHCRVCGEVDIKKTFTFDKRQANGISQ